MSRTQAFYEMYINSKSQLSKKTLSPIELQIFSEFVCCVPTKLKHFKCFVLYYTSYYIEKKMMGRLTKRNWSTVLLVWCGYLYLSHSISCSLMVHSRPLLYMYGKNRKMQKDFSGQRGFIGRSVC